MSSTTANVTSAVTSGLGAGIDTTALVKGLVAAESIPITALQTQQTNVQSATTTITAFSNQMSTLQTAAQALAFPLGFSSMAAASSDSSVVASANGTTNPGTYSVNVLSVAREQRTYSDTQTSNTGALNMSGNLSLTIGSGSPATIAVTATDSLADIATKIASSGARVAANVVYDGSAYRLLVRGLDSGAANAITFGEDPGVSLGLSHALNTTQSAQDASVKVDGFTYSRPTNQITGVIPGVSFAVTQPNVTTTLQVSSSNSAVETKINAFVTAYNAMVSSTHTATGYGALPASNTLLRADGAMRGALGALSRMLTSPVSGASSPYSTLASVGLHTTQDGTLAFDTSKFEAANAANPSAVARLFVTDAGNGSTGIMKQLSDKLTTLLAPNTSPVASELASFNARNTSLGKQITKMQARVDSYQAALQKQFLAMDNAVNNYRTQINAITSSTSSSSG